MLVKYVNQPKPGKKLGNVQTTDNRIFFFDPAEFMFTPNAEYNIETKPLPFKSSRGEEMLVITKVLPNAGAHIQQPAQPAHEAPARTGNGDNIPPWWQPFVSNTVAHAIQAGLIKSPVEINQWALKAAQVAVAVKSEAGQ